MNWVLLRNSLFVGSLTTLLSVTLGFLAAVWLAALPARLRPWFFAAAVGAFALPPFLVTNCWLHYLGHAGVWHAWLPFDLFSLAGTIWVLTLLLWPLGFFLIWGAWQRLEAAQLESDLLVRGGALMRVLLLPLAREAIILASLLIFALALNNFAVPAILQVKVLPAEMWVRFNTEFDTLGALKASYPLLVAPALLLLLLRRRALAWPNVQGPVSGNLFRRQLGPVWWCVSGCCSLALLLCSVILPLFQILSAPRTWSELFGAVAAGQGAIENSLLYSVAGATSVTGMALLFTAVEARGRAGVGTRISNALGRFFSAAGWLAFLLPGVLLGIALIYAFNHQWSARIYQSGIIVIVAFTIRYFVIGHYAVGQASRRIDPNLLDVARIEGASRWQMLRHAIGPQILRPLLVSWYLIFLLCLWDVESMILVVPPGGETLALRVFNLLHYGHNAQVNALCLTLSLVALLPLLSACLFTGLRAMTDRASFLRWPKRALVLLIVSLLFPACAPNSSQVSFSSNLFATVQVIGSRGVGVGQLNKPRSVAVDNSDNLYVVDMTGRVQKFSSNGVFLLSWQMPQTDRGKPKGMGRDRDGNILVVEPHYSRVNVFSPRGQLLGQWGEHGTNAGQLSLPRGVAVNSQREFFVSEYQEIERVQKFASAENPTAAREHSGLRPPPRYLGGFGQAGNAPGEFNRPEGLCVDSQDRLYVADSCNHRIQVFARDGAFLRTYGKPGQGPGELSYPYDICVDKEGRQYVCEFGNSRIQVFDAQDRSIEIIGGAGGAPGRFSNPWGVALDSAENLYVADSQNHRVQKLIHRR